MNQCDRLVCFSSIQPFYSATGVSSREYTGMTVLGWVSEGVGAAVASVRQIDRHR